MYLSTRLVKLWANIVVRRKAICAKNLKKLKSFKLQMAYRRHLRAHGPALARGSEYSSSYSSDSSEEGEEQLMPKRKLAGLKK